MACGKTTLGAALHERTGVDFVDLDSEIEAAAGCSVAELFTRVGEAEFRAREAETLRSVIARYAGRAAVVACGGGTPCHAENLNAMLAAGRVVWLRANTDVTLRRIALAAGQRPRLAGLTDQQVAEFMRREAERRDPVYARANAVFDSSRLDTPEEIDSTSALFISTFLPYELRPHTT